MLIFTITMSTVSLTQIIWPKSGLSEFWKNTLQNTLQEGLSLFEVTKWKPVDLLLMVLAIE